MNTKSKAINRLIEKSTNKDKSRFIRAHAAVLAKSLSLGYKNTLQCHEAGFSAELKAIFDNTL